MEEKNSKQVTKRYAELREKALKYSYVDMNLRLETDSQVYLAVFDIPQRSVIEGLHTYTLVLVFGLNVHIYQGTGEAITNLEKNSNVMKAMQSLFVSCPQVLESMQLNANVEYYESNNIRVYLKTRKGVYFKELDLTKKEDLFLNMLLGNVLQQIANSQN